LLMAFCGLLPLPACPKQPCHICCTALWANRRTAKGAHIEARIGVKWFAVGRVEGALGWPAVVPVVCSGGRGGHDREEPPTEWWGQARSKSHAGRSGSVRVGVGRSFVAQPWGVSRFDRARPRPGGLRRRGVGVCRPPGRCIASGCGRSLPWFCLQRGGGPRSRGWLGRGGAGTA
jgi:hypothetical protein